MTTDKILLEGMQFFGYHGTLPEERTLGQRFTIDVELRLDLSAAGQNDDLTQTVDYSEVYRQARAIAEGTAVNLTETVAERIAQAVLSRHELVQSVRVRVQKPFVRLGDTVLAGSSVEIVRGRG